MSDESQRDVIKIPYLPPLVELAQNRDAFYFQWKLMYAAFRFSDPSTFPPMTLTDPGDVAALNRYSTAARRLARTTLLSASEQATFSFRGGEGVPTASVETQFSADDVTVGFATMFRQFFADGEAASFSSVRKIIGKRNAELADADHDVRDAMVREWKSAHAKLLNLPVRTIALRGYYDERGISPSYPLHGEGDGRSPREIIHLYNYGDLIHWGDHRVAHEALGLDEVRAAMSRMAFLDAIAGLSHLYLGFSIIVDRVLQAGSATGGQQMSIAANATTEQAFAP